MRYKFKGSSFSGNLWTRKLVSSLQSFFYRLLYFPVRIGFRECRCHLLFCQTAALSIHQSSGDFVQGFEAEGATEARVYETWRRLQCQKMWHGLRPQRTIFAAALAWRGMLVWDASVFIYVIGRPHFCF